MSEKRVLYAEDEISSRRLLQIKLEKAGVACDVVESGAQAVEMCGKNTYSLVILDYHMPGMDGAEAAARIRELSPQMPLIAITSDDDLQEELIHKGFNEVILKPAHGKEIVDLIKSYLG
jgi:CheY-like chemotaxis protein